MEICVAGWLGKGFYEYADGIKLRIDKGIELGF